MSRTDELELVEPVPTVSGDPDYDDDWRFLPFVRENGRDIPYRQSEHYKRHKQSWGRLPMRQQIDDLKRLLPTLQALRKRVKPEPTSPEEFPAELAALGIKPGDERDDDFAVKNITDALRWIEIETADDLLIRHIIADVRWPTRFWLDLKARDPKLIQAVERACRPGVNRKAGRPLSEHSTFPTPAEQKAMRASAIELLPQVKRAKRTLRESRKDKRIVVTALQQFENIAREIRSTLVDELHKKDKKGRTVLHRAKKDIVIWFVAQKHHTTLADTKKILSGIR